MANVIHNHSAGFAGATELKALIGKPIALARTIVRRFFERRELNRVLGFPDYLLKDVGIQRHDIQREALKPLWRA
jgi:uncharacterized protein YjiS (DUF1127 family)